MKRKEVLRIIDDLKEMDALLLVIWNRDMQYPRIWLREWCGFPLSVSIATAECVRNDILAGHKKPRPVRPRPIRYRLAQAQPHTGYIETVFV